MNTPPAHISLRNQWRIPPELALSVAWRDQACVYCGNEFAPIGPRGRRRATWEHIVNDVALITPENIAVCCWGCNSSKGTKTLHAWLTSDYCVENEICEGKLAPVARAALMSQLPSAPAKHGQAQAPMSSHTWSQHHIPSERLSVLDVPSADASVHDLIMFAHRFAGYEYWGSFERCAEVANGTSISLDGLRTRLFFDARGWRHSGEDPDEAALGRWNYLVTQIRNRIELRESADSVWLSCAISQLPADRPVSLGTPGYNTYTTQRDHWLGWLNATAGTGTYLRRTGSDARARLIYNRIVESQMLVWLAQASGVDNDLVSAAMDAAARTERFGSKAAAVRKILPWPIVADALMTRLEARSP